MNRHPHDIWIKLSKRPIAFLKSLIHFDLLKKIIAKNKRQTQP